MDVSFGDGVEAAAGQQDDVGLRALRHGSPRSSLVPVPVLVPVLSVLWSSPIEEQPQQREREGERRRGGGGRDGEIERGREGEKREGGRERERDGAGGGLRQRQCVTDTAPRSGHARGARAQSFP